MTQSPRRLLVGVCGGIAAYKVCGLVSHLVQYGHLVDVVMTEAAQRFVSPLTFAALTGRAVMTDLWESPEAITHIAAVRAAELFVVVPATAQSIAKLALGLADDLLTNAALAARIPILVAPAMNTAMYEHEATQAHLATLRARGVEIVPPAFGRLAEGEEGVGRLAEISDILARIEALLSPRVSSLRGRRLCITAGPTREPLDPVRFLSNPATGATGLALAYEAARRGATVNVVLGPTSLAVPPGVTVIPVGTAAEMEEAVAAVCAATEPELVIATAAVADERPVRVAVQKQKKRADALRHLDLEPTPDILAGLRSRLPASYLIGFAAETERHEEYARAKLETKRLDAIIVNDVSNARGFGLQENTWTLLTKDARYALGEGSKSRLAEHLLDWYETTVS